MICGIDEAGRGPCIGPLVIAGVSIENDEELKKYNVRDSKKISPNKRIVLSDLIKKIADSIELIIIPASDIDDMRNVMTLNVIEVNAFSKIIDKIDADTYYVDAADVNDKRFGEDILSRISKKPEIISKHKADDIYPIVGAASIIAKTRRDQEIHNIASKLEKKINLPLGSGYPADPLTKKFLSSWLDEFGELPPNVRHSWKTCQKLIQNKKNKRLDDY